jgi:hypothetical protein
VNAVHPLANTADIKPAKLDSASLILDLDINTSM